MQSSAKPPVIFLMGPTASGKTDLAMALSDYLPSQLVSVDSALVYRDMNIGTAKPSAIELTKYPHHLIDICDAAEPYSVAEFCRDAKLAINSSLSDGKVPILVGGSMMYFKALIDGLANMPETDIQIREAIRKEAKEQGWPAMHHSLSLVDPDYAKQLHPNHSQRISRALEVYRSTGKTMSEYRAEQGQKDELSFLEQYEVIQFALLPDDRSLLHQRIEKRFLSMLEREFVQEVEALRQRSDLHLDLPSMRSVGYRQVWQYLDGEYDFSSMTEKGIAATRQLAKRQITWLRGWPNLLPISVGENMNELTLKKNVEFILNFLPTKSI